MVLQIGAIAMTTHLPEGRRFSHVYLERGEPRADSVRARHRISTLLWDLNLATSNSE